MAKVLGADLLLVEQVDINMLAEHDLIGFGSGIYFGKHHRSLLAFAHNLPVLENKDVFIFSTSGIRKVRFIHDFHMALKKRLLKKGLNIIGEFSCRGFDTFGASRLIGGLHKGKPDEKDLKRAEDFARSLKDKPAQ